jgi:hypothetical protein
MDCPLKYVEQTGRTFNARYKEHIHDIRSNNSDTGYSNHLLNTEHTYGTMQDTKKNHNTRKKRKIFEHVRKISHL